MVGEAQKRLKAWADGVSADSVNIVDIGVTTARLFEEFPPTSDERAFIDACKRYVVTQALLDLIAQKPEELSVRQILPDIDLFGRSGEKIERKWVQRFWKDNDNNLVYTNYRTVWVEDKDGKPTTKTVSLSDNRVMLVFGAQDLTPSEVIAQGKPLHTQSIEFRRRNAKIISINDVSFMRKKRNDTKAVAVNNIVLFEMPVIYKKNDSAEIYFNTDDLSAGSMDNIALLGLIAEPIGNTQLG